MFDRIQRVFHWGTTAAYAVVVFTGIALYDPFAFEPVTDFLGIPLHGTFPSYVFWHVVGSVSLAILLAIHIVWDIGKLKSFHMMWPTKDDVREQVVRVRGLISGSRDIPRANKYDSFMKFFHIILPVTFLGLAITGVYQYFFASWWTVPIELHFEIEPFWRPTIIHDIFGFVMIALVIGHTYFAILPVNRSVLRAMFTGRLTSSDVKKRFKPDTFTGVLSRSKEERTDEKE